MIFVKREIRKEKAPYEKEEGDFSQVSLDESAFLIGQLNHSSNYQKPFVIDILPERKLKSILGRKPYLNVNAVFILSPQVDNKLDYIRIHQII